MTRPTLTITECCEVLRANNISVDNKELAAAMNAPGANLQPKIFKHRLALWLKDMTGQTPVAIEPEWL